MCLAQRMVFAGEPEWRGDSDVFSGFKLLRLDESEDVWGRKAELEEKVCQGYFLDGERMVNGTAVARSVASEAGHVKLGLA
jgi:hypothetical protein